MRTELARKLAASTAAGALGVLLLAAPALAQGQPRENRAAPQAGGEMRGGGGEMRGGGQARGGAEMRGGGEMRGSGRARVDADTRSNVRAQGNVQTRGDVRVQGRRDGRNRADVRIRDRADANIRTGIRSDRRAAWRDDWRGHHHHDGWRHRGTSFSVGVGISDPYYSYGYDDGYGSYAAAEPYGYRRGYGDGYYSYGAASGCACPTPYASYNTGWGGHGWGFAAW